MLDFSAMRRRALAAQEREGLGTDGFALAQHVFELLAEVKDSNQERDEARELHAKLCDQYADALVRLNRVHAAVNGWQRVHARDAVSPGPDRDAVAMNGAFVGTIPATVNNA